MAVTNVPTSDTFDAWRIKTNTISADLGDPDAIYNPLITNVVAAVNDLETKKAAKGFAIAMAIALG